MSLAVIQMTSTDDVGENLASARHLLEQAAEAGARFALLPENFAAMGSPGLAALARAEAQGTGPVLPWLAQTCRDLALWLVAGSLPLPPDDAPHGKPRACSLLFNEQGERVARYDKLHLFDVDVPDDGVRYRESDDYDFGNQVTLVDTPFGRVGLCICYDLRFPELFAALRAGGAEILCVPAAFTAVTGTAHWEILLRARAIETQCYLLAAGQGGSHPGQRQTHGHSMIVDPWGKVLAERAAGAGVILAGRDAALQQSIRQRMPLARQRRFAAPVLL